MAPTLCLNMIVKNEAAILERALASVAPYIDHYIICDTGSTDGTPDLIRRFFGARGISGEVHSTRFIHFEQARNEALKLAQDSPRPFQYILLLDADMELRVQDPAFRESLTKDFYSVFQESAWLRYANIRLVKKGRAATYVGVTHEHLSCDGEGGQLNGVSFFDHASGSSRAQKYERDIALLTDALARDPKDARYRFYLAQSYFDVKRYPEAMENYQTRISLGGWDEEVFYSHYRIGQSLRALGVEESRVVSALLECHQYRPSRAEPLHELAAYYRSKLKHALAYLFASAAAQIPFPEKDILFVEKRIYDHQILDELAVSAYWVGRYRQSRDLCVQLLNSGKLPEEDVDRVRKNLQFAEEKLR